MLSAVAAFEFRQQVKSPVFAIVFAISLLLVFGSVAVEQIRIGPDDGGLRNSASDIVQAHAIWSLFFLFTAVAFVAEAVIRDEQTGFAPVLRSAPVTKRDHLLGRFVGAFGVLLACFASVPLGLLLGAEAPWLTDDQTGPTAWPAYARALALFALPNLFISAAMVFGLAAATRSLSGAYAGAVALLVVYGLGAGPGSGQAGPALALMEPFGFAAEEAGLLLPNRALWLTLAAAAVLWAVFRKDPGTRRPAAPPADAEPQPQSAAVEAVRPRFGPRTALVQFGARTTLEVKQVLAAPVFAVVIALGLFNVAGALWPVADLTTAETLERLSLAFRLAPMTVILFYAGELVWNEHDRRVHQLTGSAPTADWAFLMPKLVALVLVLLASVLAAAVAAASVQTLRGAEPPDFVRYATEYVVPRAYDWALVAVLAVFLQAVSPTKFVGWGWMVLYFIASLTLENLGLTGSVYRYGGHSDALATGAGTLIRAYWGALAAGLLVLSYALWGRGADTRMGPRFALAARRLRGRTGVIAATSLVAFIALGLALA